MKAKMIIKLSADIGMTGILMLLMAYEMAGQAAHEWLGIGMSLLAVLHHVLNRHWGRGLLKGKYMLIRIWQTFLVLMLSVSMMGAMVSGILISRHVFVFIPVSGGQSFGRGLHMLSVYWGFVLMAVHLGFHWNMILGMAGRIMKKASAAYSWTLRILALTVAIYGIAAFGKRRIGDYLFMKQHFAFFDYEEPLLFFLLDYLCIMGFFVWIGHYFTMILKWCSRHADRQTEK